MSSRSLRGPRSLAPILALALAVGPGLAASSAFAAEPSIVVARVGRTTPGGSAERPTVGAAGTPEAADEILIRYEPGTTAAERDAVVREHGLTTLSEAPDGQTAVVTAEGVSIAAERRHLADEDVVQAVAPNHRRELADDITGEEWFGELWGLHNTGQMIDGERRQKGVNGIDIDGPQALALGIGDPSVVVAVIDDGIDLSHPELVDRAWTNPGEAGALATNGIDDDGNGYIDDVHGWDFCNNDNTLSDPGKDGHGTHVSGTIAASLDGEGVVGVAPGVSLMGLKFIESNDCGTDAMAVAAIDYAASFGVRIINASWGGPDPSTVLDAAIADSGALFVAAAGNWGIDMDTGSERFYPAASTVPTVISVAAIDQTGALAAFSNRGRTTVDIAAPGTNILSTWRDGDYAYSAGTSMAAPHVSGVAALVGSHRPDLLAKPTDLRARLLATGRPLSKTSGKTASGRMVRALTAIDTTAPPALPANRFGLRTGTTVGASSVSTVVRWPEAPGAVAGDATYSVKRHGPGGWSTVTASTTTRAVDSTLRYGSDYLFRVRATDQAGNASAAQDGPTIRATLHHDGTSLARYSKSWRSVSSASALGARLHTSSKAGAWATFRFTGRSVALVAPKSRSRGSFRVYVDGVLADTVSLHRSTPKARSVVFSRIWTGRATHTIRIVVVGTKGHPRVDVDGFVVIR